MEIINKVQRSYYNSVEAINYTVLKNLEKSQKSMVEPEEEYDETDVPLNMGLLYELLLDNEDTSKFLILEEPFQKPTDKYILLCNEIINTTIDPKEDLEEYEKNFIVQLAKKYFIGGNTWNDDRIYKDVLEKSSSYYKYKMMSRDKTIIFKDEYEKIKKAADKTLNGRFTKNLFNVYYERQVGIFGRINNNTYKGILDRYHIDSEGKCIIIDYKITFLSYNSINYLFSKGRFDIQFCIYKSLMNNYYDNVEFYFLIYSLKDDEDPILLKPSDRYIRENLLLDEIVINDTRRKTVRRLTEEYNFHKKTGIYSHNMEIIKNNGIIII